jgi:uncharacterized membrane protein YhiD involved in acid resistance
MENPEKKLKVPAIIQQVLSGVGKYFITICVAIMTLCATTMVSFIWDLKGEFSAEKQKVENTLVTIGEMKGDVKENRASIDNLRNNSISHEARITNLEYDVKVLKEDANRNFITNSKQPF